MKCRQGRTTFVQPEGWLWPQIRRRLYAMHGMLLWLSVADELHAQNRVSMHLLS